MRFLETPPRFLFFTGKGGVGKTSIACASAIQLAQQGSRVLLVSTDPASNVGQVFGLTIGNDITPIPAVPRLEALEIDPQAAAQIYRERIVGPVRGLLPDSVVRGIEEQLSGACTTEIAAFDEFTGLLLDSELTREFDHILFDTAPTGHTIRLLQLPGAWNDFLEAGKGDASCLGPLSGLGKQRSQYKAAVDALADPVRTRLILVARAQGATLREVARTHRELASIGLKKQYLVINGVMPEAEAEHDDLAAAIVRREQTALAAVPGDLKLLPCDYVSLKPFNMVGLDALRNLFSSDSGPTAPTKSQKPVEVSFPNLARLVEEIANDGHGLVMFMGKGGVGKTTLAAAVAVELARRGLSVHLTTSDPAAHLTETLDGSVENLIVSRIDPEAETERYRMDILETKSASLDAQGKALLEEDLRSPCTEEIAVFQAFSRIIREAETKFVVMDTAPTGHTLLLLDATGAYDREVKRQSSTAVSETTPMMQLQDPRRTKILLATLAETTPVLEAENLQIDLLRANIQPWAWIINQSVAAGCSTSALMQRRAENEFEQIEDVARLSSGHYAVVPLLPVEPSGISSLGSLTSHPAKMMGQRSVD